MQILFRVEGKMSTFGGPKDTGMKPTEGLALFGSEQDMINHGVGDLLLPEGKYPGLGRRLDPKTFYVACRWPYSLLGKEYYKSHWVVVENARTGRSMRARPVDWGPAEWTNRVADLSPGLAAELGLETNDVCSVTITDATSEFGIVVDHDAPMPLLATLAGPRIHTTEEWGAVPAKVTYFAEAPAVGIVIHNTEYPNRAPLPSEAEELAAAFANARAIQRDHMAPPRNWSDTGQHFTVSQGGIVTEGRHGTLQAARAGRVVRGAHCPGANDEWWGIEIAGDNRADDVVTPAQWQAVVDLCRWLSRMAGGRLEIQPHDHFKSTSCPGHIGGRIQALRDAVAAP